ncbi:hypothetical protein [Cytobacillus firmus]|uniref:hypothetical protein n=1 Tax=Cytobacillus firmus TaxID=1399 RepID=UPI0018CD5F04|nr:hypothetical protein [Cytobacillus firmus]MBG9657836.1 hypothetical protein [Cytobacillus firmus]MED1904842.1 hypothetical protein [Cytobacillus firmus]
MVTYVCNKCKKAIYIDDIEAIEIEPIKYKMLFEDGVEYEILESDDYEYKQFDNAKKIHLCEGCKKDFYDFI